MTKNPFINALSASAYIILITTLMNFIMKTQGNKPDTPHAPIVFLSLLTLSVTIMAYIFFYQPLQLFLGDKKKEAADLFIKTVGVFGVITAVWLTLLFMGLL